MPGSSVLLYSLATIAIAVVLALLARQYRRCPEGKLLVVYGAHLPGSLVVLDSGGRFVLPVIQGCAYLSLAPIVLSQRGQADYPRAVRIGDTAELRHAAALQLVGLSDEQIVSRVEAALAQPDPQAGARLLQDRLAELGLEVA